MGDVVPIDRARKQPASSYLTREMLEKAWAAASLRQPPIEPNFPVTPLEAEALKHVLVWIDPASSLGIVVPAEVAGDAVSLGYEIAHRGHQAFYVQNHVTLFR